MQEFAESCPPGGRDRLLAEAADVSKQDGVERFFTKVDARFGGLDFLVNNAGVGHLQKCSGSHTGGMAPYHRIEPERRLLCSHAALPRMRQRGAGYIINISSLAGKNPFAGGAAYNASKFGVNGFSEAMMLDHRYDNVRVSYIMPGSVDTDFGSRAGTAPWKIQPEDIAELAVDAVAYARAYAG